MAELYANILGSADGMVAVLAAPIASTSQSSISVSQAAPAGLQGGQFRARIDDELVLVTSGQETTTWSIDRAIEGSVAATHLTGARVRHVLTRGGLVAQTGFQVVTGPGDPDPDPADYTEPMFWDQLL
jgi:hypothetical protein